MSLQHRVGVGIVVSIPIVEREHHVTPVRLLQSLLQVVESDDVKVFGGERDLVIKRFLRSTPQVSIQQGTMGIADPVVVQDQHTFPGSTGTQRTTATGQVECS